MVHREILSEEKLSDSETMKRENRRIAAMSWGGGEGDEPPPKPSRTPMTDSTSKLFQIPSMEGERTDNGAGQAMTYIVAQNPAILAQLMRENEKRGINPSAYTTPASVFNVLAVEFDQTTENKPAEEIPLITSKIQALTQIPNPNVLGGECDGEASYLPMTSGLPPQAPDSKCKSLERNLNQNAVSAFTRISSLERRQQQMPDYSMKNNSRSSSLLRQYSAGLQLVDNAVLRSASLERNQQLPLSFKTSYSNSFEKFQNPPPPPYVRPIKGGSLERSQAIVMNDLMRKYYDQKALNDAQKPRSGGSLERNVQYQQYLMQQKQQLQQQLQAQHQQQQLQAQQHMQAQQQQQNQRPEEIIEENIYDFGGVHVKSCATIALKKSIERGMLPPNVAMRSPVFETNSNPSSGPSSLENRPSAQQQQPVKQPCPGIASRMMVFQQKSNTPPPPPQRHPSTQKTFSNPPFFNPPAQAESNIPQREPQQVRGFSRFVVKFLSLIFFCVNDSESVLLVCLFSVVN